MMGLYRKLSSLLYIRYKRNEFLLETLQGNIEHAFIAAIFFLVFELVVFFLPGSIEFPRLPVLIFALIQPGFLWFTHRYRQTNIQSKRNRAVFVLYCYLVSTLGFGLIMSLLQVEGGHFSLYIMICFGVVSFFHMTPAKSALLLGGGYLILFFALPLRITNYSDLMVLRVNFFGMSLFAWFVGVTILRLRYKAFLQELELIKKNQLLERQVQLDAMTGLYNHNAILQTLQECINRAHRTSCPLAVLMIDIDLFKRINDEYGHAVGDQVIKQFAEILQKTVRITDFVGRYGGDEFFLVLENTSIAGARLTAQRIKRHVASASWSQGLSLTFTSGVSIWNSQESFMELVERTDQKLYHGKAQGSNRVVETLNKAY